MTLLHGSPPIRAVHVRCVIRALARDLTDYKTGDRVDSLQRSAIWYALAPASGRNLDSITAIAFILGLFLPMGLD